MTTRSVDAAHTVIEWTLKIEPCSLPWGRGCCENDAHRPLSRVVSLFPVTTVSPLLFTAGPHAPRPPACTCDLPNALVVVAAFIGAQIGCFLGAKWGRRFSSSRTPHPQDGHLEKAEHYFCFYGGRSLVIGRFIPFSCAPSSIAAGIARYTKFLVFNTLGSASLGRRLHPRGRPPGQRSRRAPNLTLILGVIISRRSARHH